MSEKSRRKARTSSDRAASESDAFPKNTMVQDRQVWQKDGKEMVRVPAGEFLYGEDKHKVSLPEFWIDRTPVTNAEFTRFAQATGYKTTAERTGVGCANTGSKWEEVFGADWQHPGGPQTDTQSNADHPVVQVSWEDAVTYAEWVGKRLPTEQEWEKAARGMDGREYPWGDQEPTRELCNFNRNEEGTTPVGKYSPQGDSPYGCVDIAGNVWEWTASDHDSGGKVLRGGGWSHPAEYVRLTLRSPHHPDDRYDTDGFRCVRGALPIVTERLVLRRYTHDDIPDVLGFASQPSVAGVTSRRIPATEEGVRKYIDLQNSYQPFEEDKVFELAIERKEDGKVIGLLGLIHQDGGQGEVGWALGVEYRGQGYATEAARALMDYGFKSLGLHRIHADTSTENPASWRIMERLGMRREGLLRGAVYEEGEWVDRYVYGVLADEWSDAGWNSCAGCLR